MRKLLCFDYDGVIVDSFDAMLLLCQRAQRVVGLGRAPTADDLRTVHTLTFDALAGHIGVPIADAEKYGREVLYQQRLSVGPVAPFDGIQRLLGTLAENHDIAVITASDTAAVQDSLTTHGLARYVTRVLGGDLGLGKAERIGDAMSAVGAAPERTWMIGDAASDVREGKRAGVHTAAVTWGYQSRAVLAEVEPDIMVDGPDELLVHLDAA